MSAEGVIIQGVQTEGGPVISQRSHWAKQGRGLESVAAQAHPELQSISALGRKGQSPLCLWGPWGRQRLLRWEGDMARRDP